MTALAPRKQHPLARKPVRRRHDVSSLLTRWVGRQVWRGCRWCVVESGRRGKGVAVRTGRNVASPVRQWSADRARFGMTSAVVACGGCGARVRMDRQHEHACVADAHLPEVAAFTGDAARADEPIKATAVRLDQPHHDQPFASRQTWAKKPRLADMSNKEFRAYTAELRAQDRARRDDAIEAELWRQAGAEPPEPADLDEDGDTGATVVPITRKEVAMTEPKDWATNAQVFAEHGITSTQELVLFLQDASYGGQALVEHVSAFAEAMNTANVDDKVVGSLGEAVEAAQELVQRLHDAWKQANEVYGDTPQPDFSKAS